MKIFIVLICFAALMGCQPSTPKDKFLQKITLAFTYQPQSALIHVAMAKNYFIEEGLEIQPLMQPFGKMALQSVIDNKADLSVVAETPIMFNILKGEKIFVVANIDSSSINNAIVARKSSGISVPTNLKGKRIGFTPGTTNDFFLDSFLTANGLTRTEIQPIELKPDQMQEAIQNNTVDAVSVWNYALTLINRYLGNDGIIFYDQEIYTETFNIATRQDFVQKNPETIKRFLKALIKAEDFVNKNRAEAQSIMSQATNIDLGLIQEVWDVFGYHVTLDQMLLFTMEDETRWAMKNKLTEQTVMPNYQNYIYLDSLKAVKPEAIRMNR